MEDTDFIIEEGVKALERFFMDLNQSIRLSNIDIDDNNLKKMAKAIDSYGGYPYEDVIAVYKRGSFFV